MVPIHCVRELARFVGCQCATQEAIWVENKSVPRCPFNFEQDQRGECTCVRVRIPFLIVVNIVQIQNKCCILRDVNLVVYKVFGRKVGRRYPK